MQDVAPDRRVPAQVEAIVRRALEKSPADRWQSAEQFADAIRELPDDLEAAPAKLGTSWIAMAGIAFALLGGTAIVLGRGDDEAPETVARAKAPPAPAPAPELAPQPAPEPVPEPAVEPVPEPAPEPEPELVPTTKHTKPTKKPTKTKTEPAPAPVPDEGPIDSLEPKHLRAGIAATKKAALECGTRLGGLPGMTIKIKFTIAPDGTVTAAAPQPPFAGSKLGRCVADGFAAQTFPKSAKGRTGTAPFAVAK